MSQVLFAAATATPATRIASYALVHACELCRRVVNCHLLVGDEATPENTRHAILVLDPSLLGLEGHGKPGELALQAKEIFLSAERHEELGLLRGRVVFALSCNTARLLGELAIDYGAKAYIGWTEEFMFVSETVGDPLLDRYAWMFFKPVVEALAMLCAGRAAEAATEHIRLSYTSFAEQVLRSSDPSAQLVAAMLYHDAETLKQLGDPSATCCPYAELELAPQRPRLAPVLAALLVLLAVMH